MVLQQNVPYPNSVRKEYKLHLIAELHYFFHVMITDEYTFHFQEYPPGVTLIPMRSRTQKPFRTTNLVVIVPGDVTNGRGDSSFSIYGDALIMDPGCLPDCHAEVWEN